MPIIHLGVLEWDSLSTVTVPSECSTVVSVLTVFPLGPWVVLDVVSTVRSQAERKNVLPAVTSVTAVIRNNSRFMGITSK